MSLPFYEQYSYHSIIINKHVILEIFQRYLFGNEIWMGNKFLIVGKIFAALSNMYCNRI